MKLVSIILVFISFGLLFVFKPLKVWATQASLSCTPATGTYNIGDVFTVDYVLNTRNFDSYGTEIVATYDTSLIEAVVTTSTAITTSTNWTTPTTNTVDSTLGKIDMDFGKAQTVFKGTSSIGQITFRAKAAGQAQFNFSFFQQYDDTTPAGGAVKVWGKKDGTNISNILTDVTNCIYVIAEKGVTPTPIITRPPSTPIPTVPPVTELPRSGVFETTLVFIFLGIVFLGFGVFLPIFYLKNSTS